MKAYLLALEIQPVTVGETYEGLPLHCTLVHWFWLSSTGGIANSIQKLVEGNDAPLLHVGEQAEFTGVTKSGSIPVTVNKVQKSSEIIDLHEKVMSILDNAGANYIMPQYVHEGFVPHVTHQKEMRVREGTTEQVKSLYLVEADDPAYGNSRTVIFKSYFNQGVST